MKKIILYRISSRGYPKVKIASLSKFDCLNNLLKIFKNWEFICVADNCDEALLNQLKRDYSFFRFFETKLGNPGSFWRLYQEACEIAQEDDLFYFIEDDYWHLSNAPQAIEEGLKQFDYITLYDHPDKYLDSGVPLNPYTKLNKLSESTEIFHSQNYLWRTTNSTTMSFAIDGKTLLADADVWSIAEKEQKDHDFDNFCILTKHPLILKSRVLKQLPRRLRFFSKPKRYMGVCQPGLALHLEPAYIRASDYDRFSITKN
ncbi:MAG: hypothetical protein JHC80_08295 [Polynucleobacter sp.]|nr:hypothetical protein [Polynucleobacter sp.]